MFIAMNCFRVKRGAEGAFEKVWLSRDSYLDRVPGFVEFHLLKGPRRRRPYALCLPYGVAEQSRLRGMDQIGGVPRCARARRQRCDRATLFGASQIRGLRGTTDGNSQGGGRMTRFPPLRLVLWEDQDALSRGMADQCRRRRAPACCPSTCASVQQVLPAFTGQPLCFYRSSIRCKRHQVALAPPARAAYL